MEATVGVGRLRWEVVREARVGCSEGGGDCHALHVIQVSRYRVFSTIIELTLCRDPCLAVVFT